MTKDQIIEQLTANGIEHDASATKDELQDLLNTSVLTNGGSNTGDAGKTDLSHLFTDQDVRMEVEAFANVNVGQVVTAPMTSFRMSRDGEWYLGTIKLGGTGTVQVVVGSTDKFTFDQMYSMKGRAIQLVYTGERTITTREGAKQVPGFAINEY